MLMMENQTMYLKYGEYELEIVDKYKYLGIILNEHLEYSMVSVILANSTGRASGAIYNKYSLNKGFGYDKTFIGNLDYVQFVLIMREDGTHFMFYCNQYLICNNICMRRYTQNTNILKCYLTQKKLIL